MIKSVSIHDLNNIGDQMACPCDYFDDLLGAERVNAWDKEWRTDETSHLIFGGGGMIHGDLLPAIASVPRNENRKLIAWGLGHNQHDTTTIAYGGELRDFDLVGARDCWSPYRYVPCPSCLHPAFDSERPSPHADYAIYHHKDVPIVLHGMPYLIPVWSNALGRDSFREVLAFLSTGQTIITNTYHGAYWGLLLGRKVVVYKPFSSRFYGFKYQPPFCDEKNWRDIQGMAAPVDYLAECRGLNQIFYEDVKELIA